MEVATSFTRLESLLTGAAVVGKKAEPEKSMSQLFIFTTGGALIGNECHEMNKRRSHKGSYIDMIK